MTHDKDKNKSPHAKREDESSEDFEARTKTMTDEERAALDSDEMLDGSDSKAD